MQTQRNLISLLALATLLTCGSTFSIQARDVQDKLDEIVLEPALAERIRQITELNKLFAWVAPAKPTSKVIVRTPTMGSTDAAEQAQIDALYEHIKTQNYKVSFIWCHEDTNVTEQTVYIPTSEVAAFKARFDKVDIEVTEPVSFSPFTQEQRKEAFLHYFTKYFKESGYLIYVDGYKKIVEYLTDPNCPVTLDTGRAIEDFVRKLRTAVLLNNRTSLNFNDFEKVVRQNSAATPALSSSSSSSSALLELKDGSNS